MLGNLLNSVGQYSYSDYTAPAAPHPQASLSTLAEYISDHNLDAFKAAIEPLSLDVFTARTPDTGQTLLMLGALTDNAEMQFLLSRALNEKLTEIPVAHRPGTYFEFESHRGLPHYKAIVDAQDQNGNTALMLAVQADNESGFVLLKMLGAEFFAENTSGHTVMSLIEDLPAESLVAHRVRAHMRPFSLHA